MEIPQTYIQRRHQGVQFYDNIIEQIKSLKIISMKSIISNNQLSESEREVNYELCEQFYNRLTNEISSVKQAYYDAIGTRFKHILKMDENNMDEDEEEILRSTLNWCNAYKQPERNSNLQLLSIFSKESLSAEAILPSIANIYYEGINNIIENYFGCTIDKSKAKSIDEYIITRYPIFAKNGTELISTGYQQVMN